MNFDLDLDLNRPGRGQDKASCQTFGSKVIRSESCRPNTSWTTVRELTAAEETVARQNAISPADWSRLHTILVFRHLRFVHYAPMRSNLIYNRAPNADMHFWRIVASQPVSHPP